MSRRGWIITVVDRIPKPWPPASQLVETGVPVDVAADYARVRRELSPNGLKRRLKERVN